MNANNYEASLACFAFRMSGVKCERKLQMEIGLESGVGPQMPPLHFRLYFVYHLFTSFACRRILCNDVLHFK